VYTPDTSVSFIVVRSVMKKITRAINFKQQDRKTTTLIWKVIIVLY
jgi:hypothetical protein